MEKSAPTPIASCETIIATTVAEPKPTPEAIRSMRLLIRDAMRRTPVAQRSKAP